MNDEEFVIKEAEYEQFKEAVFESLRNLAAGFNDMIDKLEQTQEKVDDLEHRVDTMSKSIYGANLRK